jgi:hypothetical protein
MLKAVFITGLTFLPYCGVMLAANTSAQDKASNCNDIANKRSLTGDDRKNFLSSCMQAQSPADMSQTDKMKKCNEIAKNRSLKGQDRRDFMSSCLSATKPK